MGTPLHGHDERSGPALPPRWWRCRRRRVLVRRLRCVERDQGARTHPLPRVRVPSHVQEAHQAHGSVRGPVDVRWTLYRVLWPTMPASTRIRPSAPPPPQPPLPLPLPRSLLSCSSAERLTCTTSLLSRPPLLHHCTFFSNAQRSLARFPLLTARTSGRHARLALYDGRRAGCRRPHWSGTPA